jgi:hypothetical protein
MVFQSQVLNVNAASLVEKREHILADPGMRKIFVNPDTGNIWQMGLVVSESVRNSDVDGTPCILFLPALVRTYNAGLSFALLLFLFLGSQSLLKILHYCPISPCIQQPCRQPCPAVRPISTRFDALARSLALQSPHCTTVAGHQTACARCCPDRFKLVQLFLCRPIAP